MSADVLCCCVSDATSDAVCRRLKYVFIFHWWYKSALFHLIHNCRYFGYAAMHTTEQHRLFMSIWIFYNKYVFTSAILLLYIFVYFYYLLVTCVLVSVDCRVCYIAIKLCLLCVSCVRPNTSLYRNCIGWIRWILKDIEDFIYFYLYFLAFLMFKLVYLELDSGSYTVCTCICCFSFWCTFYHLNMLLDENKG